MHSRRGLMALALVAAALIGAVIADMTWPRQPARARVRLLPADATARGVARVIWERPGEAPLVLARDPGGALALPGSAGAVDADVVADILGALETVSLGRRRDLDASALGLAPPRLLVRVELDDGRALALALGAPVPALDRVWAARRARAGDGRDQRLDAIDLIDGHLARALDRRADDLRVRRVVAAPAHAIEAVDLRQGAARLRIEDEHVDVGPEHGLAPGRVRVDPARFAELAERLAALAVVHFVDTDAPAAGLSVRVRAAGRWLELVELGPCPGTDELRLVRTSIGAGCVAGHALDALADALAAGPAWWSREPLPDGVPAAMAVTDAGGRTTRLERTGRTWKLAGGGLDIDSGAVEAWLGDLARASADELIAAGRVTPGGALVLAVDARTAGGRGEQLRVWSHPRLGLLGRRGDEPVYLRLAAEPFASRLLPVGPLRFARRQILSYDPYQLVQATLRRGPLTLAHVLRGELLDEWLVGGPAHGRARAEIIDALHELARLRALALVAEEPAPAHGLRAPRRSIEIVMDAGPLASAGSVRHVLDIGAATARGCFARLDGTGPVLELDARLCATLCGPWVE